MPVLIRLKCLLISDQSFLTVFQGFVGYAKMGKTVAVFYGVGSHRPRGTGLGIIIMGWFWSFLLWYCISRSCAFTFARSLAAFLFFLLSLQFFPLVCWDSTVSRRSDLSLVFMLILVEISRVICSYHAIFYLPGHRACPLPQR